MKAFQPMAESKTALKISTLVLALSLPFLNACKPEPGWETASSSSDSSSSSSASNVDTYHGAGSNWELGLNQDDSSFTLELSATPGDDIDGEIDGDYETLSSGFTRLTVSSSDITDVSADDTLDGINLEDAFMILLPFGSDLTHPLVLSRKNGCADSIDSNWVIYKPATTTNSEVHAEGQFGQFTYYSLGDGASFLSNQYSLDAPSTEINDLSLGTGECSDSLVESDTFRGWYSDAENAVLEIATDQTALDNGDNSNSQFLISVASRTLTATSDSDGDYVGIMNNSLLSTSNIPVIASCSAGICTITEITDVTDTSSIVSESYSMDLTSTDDSAINSPQDGFIVGDISAPSSSDKSTIACSINSDYQETGDKFIVCVGIAPSASDSSDLINLFLVAQD